MDPWPAAPYLALENRRVDGRLDPAELGLLQPVPLLNNLPRPVKQKVHQLVDHSIRLRQGMPLLVWVFEDIIPFIILGPVLLCGGWHLQSLLCKKGQPHLLGSTCHGG